MVELHNKVDIFVIALFIHLVWVDLHKRVLFVKIF